MAKYPPGSTFKTVNALIGLQEKTVFHNTMYSCNMGYTQGRSRLGCHSHPSPLNLTQSIQISCNAYYCNVFKNILEDKKYNSIEEAFNNWRKHLVSFGFASKLNTDFVNELTGYLPTVDLYNRIYGEGRWRFLTLRSLSIGQGEIGLTPIHIANLSAIIANRGYYYTPHIIKEISGSNVGIDQRFREKHITTIDSAYYTEIVDGMELVVNGGSGSTARIAKLNDIIICGKTGTAQNPHGKDHSIFMAFAPKDDPKIAIAVYVENAGFGSTYAAPIASLMIEKYLTDTISRGYLEKHILSAVIDYSIKK
jgi:penicillin-binding protein 2